MGTATEGLVQQQFGLVADESGSVLRRHPDSYRDCG
jgi:hypothetical protein